MTKKVSISFQKEPETVTQTVTKFGGQPIWIDKAEWPISRSTEKPMRFICQIDLEENVFDGLGGRMAYIFMTDDDDYVDGTGSRMEERMRLSFSRAGIILLQLHWKMAQRFMK